MPKRQRILVVVDPAAPSQPALERAAQVARRMDWAVGLLICVHEGLPRQLSRAADPKAVRRALLEHQVGYLKDLARGHADLQIETRAVWDRPPHEAIIRETLRSEAHLVMKDTQFQSKIARALVTNTDWHLIRDCHVPLWLVRGAVWPEKPTVVAFVDPLHEHDKPAELDHRILREGALLAKRLGGELHAVHCYDATPMVATAGAAGIPGAGGQTGAIGAELQSEVAARLDELAASEGVAPARVHLRSGAAAQAIPAAARDLNADLAVMGAVSRSRLEHAFLGNTAERVLDRIACDVLVVKPGRFESSVTYSAQPADFMELD